MSHETDPNAFQEIWPTLPIKLKRGGIAKMGDVAYDAQRRFMDWIAHKRANKEMIRRVDIKVRQLLAMSSTVGAFVWADISAHEETDAIVSAHRPDSLLTLSRMYRRFAGDKKTSSARRADYLFRAESGSYLTLQGSSDLGRSESVVLGHISEADYIDNWDSTWEVFEPTLSDAWWSALFLETTTRRGQSTEFRDFVEAARRGDFGQKWEVHFTAWYDRPDLRIEMNAKEREQFKSVMSDYEKMLVGKLGLELEQAAWWRDKLISGMRGRIEAMQEAYPSTLEEALMGGIGAEYFHEDARKFHMSNVRDPEDRYILSYDGMRRTNDPRDYVDQPHLAVWSPPRAGHRYVVGADGADADMRKEFDEGSESYAVVVDIATGEVCAEWHGYANTPEFAVALWKMAQYYNFALIVPESNASGGVISQLTDNLQYMNIYEREVFGATTYRVPGVYGFHSSGQTRPIWTGRLQDNYNRKTLLIPSATLNKQLVEFGKRRGRPQKKQARKNQIPDDGCVALAMAMFGHQNAINGSWHPKDGYDVDKELKLDITKTDRAENARVLTIPGLVEDESHLRDLAAARRFLDLS